jgi:hypothetical protein
MKKFLIAGMAIAMLAVPAVASANVAYDAQGVGTVDKGDVMQKFNWNENKFQTQYVDTVAFSAKSVVKDTYTWDCPGGVVPAPYVMTTTKTGPVNAVKVRNESANKVTSWKLDGFSAPLTTPTYASEGQPLACPGGAPFLGGFRVADSSTTITDLKVSSNGTTFDLPNTPVVTPVA